MLVELQRGMGLVWWLLEFKGMERVCPESPDAWWDDLSDYYPRDRGWTRGRLGNDVTWK